MDKKRLVTIAAVVVGIIILGGAVLTFMVWRSAQEVAKTEQASKSSKPVKQYDDTQQVVDQVNQKYGEKDYDGAIQLIEGQKNSGDPTMQLLLAGAYANSGNIAKALEIYKQLDADGKLPQSELANLADMAERAGDKQAAIAAYKKAKDYAISSKTETQDQIAVYDYKIAQLEKK